jgi:hypothetical protein
MAYEITVRGGDEKPATISERVRRAIQGIAAYAMPKSLLASLGDEAVEKIREGFGGQLALPVTSITRWTQQDIERAEVMADQGDLSLAGALMRSAHKDDVVAGIMSTRCGGLIRLPRTFRGRPEMIDRLQRGGLEARSVFDEMCPPAELEMIDRDGIELGVAVGELVRVPGRTHPVLNRLPPEHLRYRWYENRWYYSSIAGLLPITPGDGRWVLHTPGGRVYPWQNGLWRALARNYVTKEHARLRRENWEMKLANPARVAYAPLGADEPTKKNAFEKLLRWGINTVFGLPAGWDIKIVESNGRGADSFRLTIEEQNNGIILSINGQVVTVDGGSGFSNQDVHKSVRADLIQRDESSLAFTCNTQIIPVWAALEYGEDVLLSEDLATVGWDVTPPSDLGSSAQSLVTASTAITNLAQALTALGRELDIDQMIATFGIPVTQKKTQVITATVIDSENQQTARSHLRVLSSNASGTSDAARIRRLESELKAARERERDLEADLDDASSALASKSR